MQNLTETTGLLVVFVALFLEATAFLGFVVPGLSVLLAAGVAAGVGKANIWMVLIVAWTGVFSGDNVAFFGARYLVSRKQRPWAKKFVRAAEHAAVSLTTTRTRRIALVFFQFPVATRSVIPLALGVDGSFSARRWLVIDSIATTLFVGFLGGLGYAAGAGVRNVADAERYATIVQVAFSVITLTIVAAIAVRRFRARRRGPDLNG